MARGQLMKRCSAAHAADGFVAGAQIEVIGVAEDDFGAEGFERVLRDGFDGAGGADGHEDGRFDGGMGQSDATAAAAGGGFGQELEAEAHQRILSGADAGEERRGSARRSREAR